VLARGTVPLFAAGAEQTNVVLTAAGRQLLSTPASRHVTITVTAKDLAGNVATASAAGTLTGT
jgi:hypothetical protein